MFTDNKFSLSRVLNFFSKMESGDDLERSTESVSSTRDSKNVRRESQSSLHGSRQERPEFQSSLPGSRRERSESQSSVFESRPVRPESRSSIQEPNHVMHDVISDITECSICTDVMRDPRVLPCIHTFCLECLIQYGKTMHADGRMPCPMCRREFSVPDGEFSNLPKHFFIEKLLQAHKLSSDEQTKKLACDVGLCRTLCNTSKNEMELAELSQVTMYCPDCQENMCDKCAQIHSNMKTTRSHRVFPIGEQSTRDYLMNSTPNLCDEHEDKELSIYCRDCRAVGCLSCLGSKHLNHGCYDVNDEVGELRRQIKFDTEVVEKLVDAVSIRSENMKRRMSAFEKSIEKTRSDIIFRGEELKRVVERHVDSLLMDLKLFQDKKLKEFEVIKESLQTQALVLESFKRYSQEVIDKAVPVDVARMARVLSERAIELINQPIVEIGKEIDFALTPSDLDMYTVDGKSNIVGNLSISTLNSDVYTKIPTLIHKIDFQRIVHGVAVMGKDLFIVHCESPDISVYNSGTFGFQRSITVPGLSNPNDIAASNSVLFVSERYNKLIHRIELPKETVTRWQIKSLWLKLHVNKLGNLLVTCHEDDKLVEYSPTGKVIREICLQDVSFPQHAIQLENDLFVVCHTDSALHRVCLVNHKGQVVRSYGGRQGSARGQINSPYHLAWDRNGFILVADCCNNRILLLNTKMEFVKECILDSVGVTSPNRLCLDDEHWKLYVAEHDNKRVTIINVS